MKFKTFITGYHKELKDRFLVLAGGDEERVEQFNKGEFGIYAHGMDEYEIGSFKLERKEVEFY